MRVHADCIYTIHILGNVIVSENVVKRYSFPCFKENEHLEFFPHFRDFFFATVSSL